MKFRTFFIRKLIILQNQAFLPKNFKLFNKKSNTNVSETKIYKSI